MRAGNITTINASLRAPSVPRGPTARPLSGAAAGASQLGDAVTDVSLAFVRAEQNKQINEASVSALKQLDELEFEVNKDTDFTSSTKRYDEGVGRIRQEIQKGMSPGRATREFSLKFEQLSSVRGLRVKKKAFARQGDAAVATLNETLSGYSREAAAAESPQARAAIGVLAEKAIDAAAGDGYITKKSAQALGQQFVAETAETAFLNLLDSDPAQALKDIRDPKKYQMIEPNRKARLKATASGRVRADAARGRAEKNRVKASLKSDIREMLSVAKEGLDVSPELVESAMDKAEDLGDKDMTKALSSTVEIFDYRRELQTMTPAEAQASINDLNDSLRGGASGTDAAKVKAGQQVLSKMVRELNRDPLSFANTAGVVDLGGLDLGGDNLLGELMARKIDALGVAEHYGSAVKFFTDEERAGLATRYREASATQRAALTTALVNGFGNRAPDALAELAIKDPTVAHLGGLQTLGPQHRTTVQDGFRGLDVIKQKAVDLDSDAELRSHTDAELGAALDSRLAPVRRQIMLAAKAIYAARAADSGTAQFDADMFRDAVRDAAGGYDLGGRQFGGIGEHKGRKLLLPQHMDSDGFEGAVAALADDDLAPVSASGGAPVHRTITGRTRKASAADIRNHGHFVTVGPGLYQVSMTDPAIAPQYLLDEKTGRFWVMDLSDPSTTPQGAILSDEDVLIP